MTQKKFKLKLTFSTALRPDKPIYDYLKSEFISVKQAVTRYGKKVVDLVNSRYGHVIESN